MYITRMKHPAQTQHQMVFSAHRKIMEGYSTFMDIMMGPNPLTREEVDELIRRNPARYQRFKAFGTEAEFIMVKH
jgi:hypothetical protein